MKKIIILLFLTLGCSDDSYTFYYEVTTDSPAMINIAYRINDEYKSLNDIVTPWQSESETYYDSYQYYLNIAHCPENGALRLYVNSALWKSEKFYAGYDLEFEGTVNPN